jgi:hypothetical protein
VFSAVADLVGGAMSRRFMFVAVAVAVLMMLAIVLNSGFTVYAKVVRTYYLAPGDAVVFHRYGLTTNGYGYLVTEKPVDIPSTVTVCARLHTGFRYDFVYPVIDHGINYGVNWAIEAVPPYDYRIRVAFGDGEVSVVVPGEFQVPHMYCFRVRSTAGGHYLDVFVDGQLYRSVGPRVAGMIAGLGYPIYIGAYSDLSDIGMYTTITLFLLFNRPLSDSEIADIARGVIPSSGLIVYFDPGVWHYYQGVWVDLSGNGNNFRLYGMPLLSYVDYPDMFVIRGRYGDGYVHFNYFPWYSRLEIYDSGGNLVKEVTVGGVDNGYGSVIDLTLNLAPGEYTLVYYDPNEVTTTVTTTATVVETVVTTSVVNYTTTISYTTTSTVTSTVAVPVVSYSTVTVTTTEYVVPRWDWIVVALMIMVLGASVIYMFSKLR